jgi:hypothetical protein
MSTNDGLPVGIVRVQIDGAYYWIPRGSASVALHGGRTATLQWGETFPEMYLGYTIEEATQLAAEKPKRDPAADRVLAHMFFLLLPTRPAPQALADAKGALDVLSSEGLVEDADDVLTNRFVSGTRDSLPVAIVDR